MPRIRRAVAVNDTAADVTELRIRRLDALQVRVSDGGSDQRRSQRYIPMQQTG
jgi:hypothetical protein